MARQTYNNVWAESGDSVDPGTAKTNTGWIVESPPHEFFNWWMNKADQMLQHIDREGLPQFSPDTIYAINGYAKDAGKVYRSLSAGNIGNLPSTSPAFWVVHSMSPENNLSDVASLSASRDNLSVYSKAEIDSGTISSDGGTVNGDLTISGSGSPTLNVEPTVAGGVASLVLRDDSGTPRASLEFDDTDGKVSIKRYDDVGAVESSLVLTDDGNVEITAPSPTDASHLVRYSFLTSEIGTAVAPKVNRSGDTFTGVVGGVAPVLPEHFTTKQFMEAAISTSESGNLLITVSKDSDTGAANLPTGDSSQRPGSPAEGMFRRNTETAAFEGYTGTEWAGVGGARGGAGNPVFYENQSHVTADYTITSGSNAMSAGPIEIDSGVTVEVPSGSTWTIVG